MLGGNVNQVEPVVDMRYFRKGLSAKHVIGMHFAAKFLPGSDGKTAAPFNRFYIGGENDIRGFQIWGVSPVAYVPSSASVAVLNNDGSPRQQRFVDPSTGNRQPEYRHAEHSQLSTRVSRRRSRVMGQLRVPHSDLRSRHPGRVLRCRRRPIASAPNRPVAIFANPANIEQLNSQFPQASFANRAKVAPGTQAMRSSTGLELQVLMPVVNAPFRIYFAVNPNRVYENLVPPIAADRSFFPNAATFNSAVAQFGQPLPFDERLTLFRFTVGRTF